MVGHNKKSQYSTIYGMLILALSLAVMLGLFMFSNEIKNVAVKNLGERILDDVSDKIYASLIDMKLIIGSTSTDNLTVAISIPKRIGEQNYFVRGEGTTFVIRTMGKKSLVSETSIIGLWGNATNMTILGTAFSQSGKVQLDYIKPNVTLLS